MPEIKKITYKRGEYEGRDINKELHDQGYSVIRINVGVDLSKTYTYTPADDNAATPAEDDGDDLSSMTRAELNEVAEELGLDPEDYSNKAKVTKAIREARAE